MLVRFARVQHQEHHRPGHGNMGEPPVAAYTGSRPSRAKTGCSWGGHRRSLGQFGAADTLLAYSIASKTPPAVGAAFTLAAMTRCESILFSSDVDDLLFYPRYVVLARLYVVKPTYTHRSSSNRWTSALMCGKRSLRRDLTAGENRRVHTPHSGGQGTTPDSRLEAYNRPD